MPWLAKNLSGLIAVALVCGCASETKSNSRERTLSDELIRDSVAHSVRTHPKGTLATTRRASRRPFGIAVSRTGIVYCTLLDAASLIHTTLGADSLPTVAVGRVPTDVAFSPAGTWAYVTNQWAQTVGVVDTRTARQRYTIPVPGDPYRVAVGPEGLQVYATTNTGNLVLIDAEMRRVVRTVQLGGNLNGLAISSNGARVYVGDVGGTIYELDSAGDVLRQFAMPGRPQGLGLSADGSELYAAGEDGDFIVLDLETGTEVARVALGAGGFGLAVTPDQSQVWVTAPAAGRVFVLGRTSRTVHSTMVVGGKPRRLAFDQSGALVAIADEAGTIRLVR